MASVLSSSPARCVTPPVPAEPKLTAAGLAQINALGNLAGFVFNYLIGWIQAETGSFPLALMPIAAVATIGTICVLVIGRHQPRTVAITP